MIKLALLVVVTVVILAVIMFRKFQQDLRDNCPNEHCSGKLKHIGDHDDAAVWQCDTCSEEVVYNISNKHQVQRA